MAGILLRFDGHVPGLKSNSNRGLNFIFHSRFRYYFCSRETQIPFDRVDMLYKCDNEDGHD